MLPMSKVDLFAAIRRDARAGMSVRAMAGKYQVSRRTVRATLQSAWPQPRKAMPPRASKLDDFKPIIDEILRADLDAPRKQRHTVTRIYDRLIAEHGMPGVSYSVVRRYVADRKPKIRVEAGRGPVNVFFPQTHRPGEEAEVDFGEVTINLRGEPVTCTLFALRLSFSGKDVHRIFASGGTEAFLEGHVHAFTTLGGVPTGKIRYDNLRAAVAQVLGFSSPRPTTTRIPSTPRSGRSATSSRSLSCPPTPGRCPPSPPTTNCFACPRAPQKGTGHDPPPRPHRTSRRRRDRLRLPAAAPAHHPRPVR
jgi:transposase